MKPSIGYRGHRVIRLLLLFSLWMGIPTPIWLPDSIRTIEDYDIATRPVYIRHGYGLHYDLIGQYFEELEQLPADSFIWELRETETRPTHAE